MKYLFSYFTLLLSLQMFAQVGIGTTSPDEMLHIEGGTIKIVNGSQSDGKVLTTNDNGVAEWQYANGNGGRGTTTFITGYFTSSNSTDDYFHLKLPYKIDTDYAMYYIQVKGYAYGASVGNRIIDITYVGYSYPPYSDHIVNPDHFVTGSVDITATEYIGSDGYIYLRFKTPYVYYNSFAVTSMYVGNGRILKEGEITVIQSATENL